MNKKILLFSATLGIAYLGFTSYSAGPFAGEGNITGSGTKAASCSGGSCHSGSTGKTKSLFASPGVAFSLKVKSSGLAEAAGVYMPGTTYVVTFSVVNEDIKPKYGFQASCVKTTGKTKAGTLVATMANTTKKTETSGVELIEHTTALTGSTGQYIITFEWTAPATGTGDVTFYGIVNAVNGTGTTAGDDPSGELKATFKDKTTSINEKINNIASKVYPNPCSNVLNIETASTAKFMATVYDVAGRQVIAPSHHSSIDVSSLTNGLYMLRLNTEEGQQTVSFIKQ